MAIHTDNAVQGQQGFAKTLDDASTSILLDLTQENQYQYPVPSTIRELVSNAVDSTTEKLRALAILSGEKTVADFYVVKEGELYEASKFKPEYYNPTYLQAEGKNVRIEIEYRPQEFQRDILRVSDQGVGLWGERLEGYFKIGYSTKRLDSQTLGKFGLGAKAPLSMDVASFRMITTYNGMRTAFDIFNRKIEPVYGKWDANEQPRESFLFSNGVKVYYDKVEEPNGLTIEVEVKKAWRKELLDSIKSQLLYFSTVKLFIKQEWSDQFVETPFLAEIQYEDEHIILSNNNQYSAPHLVLDNGNSKVCYNKIDWAQLELENKHGNIGIKFKAEDVDIVPSREYVKWGARTREKVLEVFRKVEGIATELVEKELDEKDPLVWIQKATTIFTNIGSNTVLGKLSRIVPKDSITPLFPGTKIKYAGIEQMFSLTTGTKIRSVTAYISTAPPTRSTLTSWSQVNFNAFYFTKASASKAKDIQLYREHGQFTLLSKPPKPELDYTKVPSWVDRRPEAKETVEEQMLRGHKRDMKAYVKELRFLVWLRQSALVKDYDAVVIDPKIEEELAQQEVLSVQQAEEQGVELTAAQQRKLEGKVFMRNLNQNGTDSTFDQWEPTLKEVQNWEEPIIYGFQEDKVELGFLAQLLVKQMPGAPDRWSGTGFYKDIIIIQVSQDVAKKLPKHAVHVKSFYYPTSLTNISLHPMLRPWYTSLQVDTFLKEVPFMDNFSVFNADMTALYKELAAYVKANQPNTNMYGDKQKLYTELLETANKMATFEQYTKDHATDTEAIAEKSQELFGINSVTGSSVWDTDIQQKLEKLQLYCQPLTPLFTDFQCLRNSWSMTPELEMEIRQILNLKGVQTT